MACCPTDIPPVVNDYKGKGEHITLKTDSGEEFPAYFIGSGERAILHVPDIFGLHPNHFQVADILAGQGFAVLLVDPFYGKPVAAAPFPPAGGWGEVMTHVNAHTYAEKVRPVLVSGIAELQRRGAKKIGALGLCWGGGQVFQLSAEKVVNAVATAHPSKKIEKPDAEKLSGPVCFLPSGDDPEWKELEDYVKNASPFAKQNVYERFPRMNHGWLGARGPPNGDWEAQAYKEDSHRSLRLIADFFKTNL